MQAYEPREIADIVGGKVLNGAQGPIGGVQIDSRNVGPDDLFVAISTQTNDGHRYVPQAFAQGAVAALVSWKKAHEHLRDWDVFTLIAVDDTVESLQAWARAHRRRFDIPVIGLTGSNGKTTTKDLTANALSVLGPVLSTQGTLNNHLGVPLTLLEIDESHRAAVIEMGMNHPGEIHVLGEIAEPTAGVITNVGQAHLEFFNSMTQLVDAKWELVPTIRDGGFLVLNRDDEKLWNRRDRYDGPIHWCGVDSECEWKPSRTEQRPDGCWSFWLGDLKVELRIPGRHMIDNALFALATAQALGIPAEQAAARIIETPAAERRMGSFWANGVLVLDDAYNANPSSMRAALNTLMSLDPAESGKRVAVLGGMRELGDQGVRLHREIGRYAAERGLTVVAVGDLATDIAEGAREIDGVTVIHAPSHEDAVGWLSENVRTGDVVLAKGSRSEHIELVIEALRKNLERQGT